MNLLSEIMDTDTPVSQELRDKQSVYGQAVMIYRGAGMVIVAHNSDDFLRSCQNVKIDYTVVHLCSAAMEKLAADPRRVLHIICDHENKHKIRENIISARPKRGDLFMVCHPAIEVWA